MAEWRRHSQRFKVVSGLALLLIVGLGCAETFRWYVVHNANGFVVPAEEVELVSRGKLTACARALHCQALPVNEHVKVFVDVIEPTAEGRFFDPSHDVVSWRAKLWRPGPIARWYVFRSDELGPASIGVASWVGFEFEEGPHAFDSEASARRFVDDLIKVNPKLFIWEDFVVRGMPLGGLARERRVEIGSVGLIRALQICEKLKLPPAPKGGGIRYPVRCIISPEFKLLHKTWLWKLAWNLVS